MKYAPILLVLAAGALTGWFAPDLSGRSASSAPEEAVSPSTTVAPVEGNDIVLPRAADGHFYAEVVVGSASTRMLVDTGASVIALTGEDANAIGVPWDASQLEPVARGANGEVYGVRIVLDRVELGGLEARDVDAVVVPEGLEISLLGQSFLSRLARVAMDPDKMVLGS